jgi:hypothetical protein
MQEHDSFNREKSAAIYVCMATSTAAAVYYVALRAAGCLNNSR